MISGFGRRQAGQLASWLAAWHKWPQSHVTFFGHWELVGNNNGSLRAKSTNFKGLVFIPNMEKLLL